MAVSRRKCEWHDPPKFLHVEYKLLRIPPEIRPALEARLRVQGDVLVAWLQAICASFPERKLIDVVREGDPRFCPACLCGKEASKSMWGDLVLTDNDIVSIRAKWPEERKPHSTRMAQLEAFRACRFQQGSASEGMLCNQPPIPLRVLDFLETQDLINLSLVCKSAHQAAHLLFKREEALAASSFSERFAEDDSRAYLLRDIRLASLMHGAPEAIPNGPDGPALGQYFRENPAEPTSPRSATWGYIWGVGRAQRLNKALYYTMRYTMEMSPGKFLEPRFSGNDMSVLDTPELQALLARVVRLQAKHVDSPEYEVDMWVCRRVGEREVGMMQKLISVVSDAIERKEAILLRYRSVWASDWDWVQLRTFPIGSELVEILVMRCDKGGDLSSFKEGVTISGKNYHYHGFGDVWQDDGSQDDDVEYEDEVWPDEDDHYEDIPLDAFQDDEDANYEIPEHELLRIPPEIRHALEARLRVQPNFVVAWLQAICVSFPERKLIDVVREGDPRFFPTCLRTREASEHMRGYLGLIGNDVVSVRDDWPADNESREASRKVDLEAFRACRFQQGFASEGMLCNQPPIPLRVLDFLETQDLLNLSLVCKSAHQAAHVLFKQEEVVAASSFPEEYAATDRQAGLLRDFRLASLMHGTPEAIPGGQVRDLFIRQSAAKPASLRSVTWGVHGDGPGCMEADLFNMFHHAIYSCAGKFSARRDRQLDDMCVLEAPQIQALQANLVELQTGHSEALQKAGKDEVEMLRKLFSVVYDALAMGEYILLRTYDFTRP